MRSHIGIPLTIGLGVLLTVAACGTSTPSSTPAAGGTNQPLSTSAGSGSTTVSVSTVNGQPVLVDQAGAALYTNNKDGSTLQCVSSDCNAIWAPLTVPGGSKPTAASGVTGTVATVKRPDGGSQVTLDGKPLYTFSFDHGAGHVTGNGQMDSFDGTNFTWHSALASGQQAPAPAPTTAGNGGGGYGNGYGGGY
jgi:predicted lipoprotein with Yx(FWY)xxD motif